MYAQARLSRNGCDAFVYTIDQCEHKQQKFISHLSYLCETLLPLLRNVRRAHHPPKNINPNRPHTPSESVIHFTSSSSCPFHNLKQILISESPSHLRKQTHDSTGGKSSDEVKEAACSLLLLLSRCTIPIRQLYDLTDDFHKFKNK